MPTKHIDEQTFALAEEKLVEAVVRNRSAVKETEILALLISIGAEHVTEEDYLTRLPVKAPVWNEMAQTVFNECAASYPREFIYGVGTFETLAGRYSAEWRRYRSPDILNNISEAAKRLGLITYYYAYIDNFVPDYDNREEEARADRKKLEAQLEAGHTALNGKQMGTLSADELSLTEHILESDDYQINFIPVPGVKRPDGEQDFRLEVSRFPDTVQSQFLALIDGLKPLGYRLACTRQSLHQWLIEPEQQKLSLETLIERYFLSLEIKQQFTFDGDAELVEAGLKKLMADVGLSLSDNMLACSAINLSLKAFVRLEPK